MKKPGSRPMVYVMVRRVFKAAAMVVLLLGFGFILSRTDDGPMAIDTSHWWSGAIPEPVGDVTILGVLVMLAFWVGRHNWLE